MITILLLLIVLWSFYIGYSRGIVLQGYYTVASIVAFIIAAGQYQKLINLLYLWVPFASATQGASTYYFDSRYLFSLDQVFYAGLAFLIIYVSVYSFLRFLGLFLHLVRFVDPDTSVTNLVSGALSVVVTIVSLQIVLTIGATIPLAEVQEPLHNSWLANMIIQYTPVTSQFLQQLWLAAIR